MHVLLKIGSPRCVTMCDRGGGVKIGQKFRDVLYGRPLSPSRARVKCRFADLQIRVGNMQIRKCRLVMQIWVLQWVKCRLENADCNSRLLVKNWGYVNYFRYMYILTSWFVDKKR